MSLRVLPRRGRSFLCVMNPWKIELRKTLLLAFPIILSQVSQHLVQVIDSAMIGRVGVVPLAASAFASSVFAIPLVFSFGITGATTILASSAHGAGNQKQANHVLRVGLFISTLLGLVFALAMQMGVNLLGYLGQTEAVYEAAKPYFLLLVWSIVPALIFSCFKCFAEAMNRPWMPFKVLMVMLGSNVLLNWIFIFGKLGFPAMGLEGAGWATLISRVISAFYLGYEVVVSRYWKLNFWNRDWFAIKVSEIREYLGIGIPSAFQIIFEVSAFVISAIMMGWISEVTLAAHQISINVAATTFMVVLGVAFAISVRTSHYYGKKDYASMRQVGWIGWWINFAFMAACMLSLALLRYVIPTWFVDAQPVIDLAARLLIVAALFQVFDGLQVVMISALRAMRDIRIPTLLTLFVYYGICLPLAYILGFVYHMGGVGVWIGLATGLGFSAILLTVRFQMRANQMVRRATL
jgi:MATE family multidrug resistance protein